MSLPTHSHPVPATDAAALTAFEPLARSEVTRFGVVPGLEFDDLMQHARVAIVRARAAYRGGRMSYGTFARLCIRRALNVARAAANADKHRPLNDAARFEFALPPSEGTDEGLTFGDTIPDPFGDAAVVAESRELLRRVAELATALPRMQRAAFAGRLRGLSPAETAAELGCSENSVRTSLYVAARRVREQLRAEGVLA